MAANKRVQERGRESSRSAVRSTRSSPPVLTGGNVELRQEKNLLLKIRTSRLPEGLRQEAFCHAGGPRTGCDLRPVGSTGTFLGFFPQSSTIRRFHVRIHPPLAINRLRRRVVR